MPRFLQLLHLLLKHLGRDFGIRPSHLIDEAMVAVNDDLSGLIDRSPLQVASGS